ncbi:hypothetical protein [Botrimarina sp.]|uniref:hypothetical protein n=1 Tax=Botrimarina sp. TaxID=2795802 RepID=UPI0032EB1511
MSRRLVCMPYPAVARAALLVASVAALAAPAEGQFWNPFRSREKPAPQRAEPAPPPATPASLDLSQESGPWLIVASTFSGEGAEDQATELALELRERYGLSAYVHEQTFDLRDAAPVGRGIDERGRPVRMRYRSGDSRTEWAVLVGDYPSVDDTIAQRDLEKLRKAEPAALEVGENGQTRQNFSNTRKVLSYLAGRDESAGPMRMAFMTRNPLLPEEFFKPKGVDPFVAKMNKQVDHSALEIKGKYTVKVASFGGRGTLVGASTAKRSGAKRDDDEDPLVQAAENAHLLCEAMRAKGWDAYEFHDRTESCVMVGSFEEVLSAGEPRAEVMEVIRTFGAAFDTPAAPLEENRPTDPVKAQQVVRQVGQQLGGAQMTTNMNPKYAMLSPGRGQAKRPIPFDIHPEVVEAPKQSVSSSLAWRN